MVSIKAAYFGWEARSWIAPGTKSKRFPFLSSNFGLPKDAHQQAATDVLCVRIRDPKLPSA